MLGPGCRPFAGVGWALPTLYSFQFSVFGFRLINKKISDSYFWGWWLLQVNLVLAGRGTGWKACATRDAERRRDACATKRRLHGRDARSYARKPVPARVPSANHPQDVRGAIFCRRAPRFCALKRADTRVRPVRADTRVGPYDLFILVAKSFFLSPPSP